MTTPLSDLSASTRWAHFDSDATWSVFIRDDDTRQLVGEVDSFESAIAICRFNAVGTWELRARAVDAAALIATIPHPAFVLRCGEETVLSGPVDRMQRDYDEEGDQLVVNGFSDLHWARARIVRAFGVDHFWRLGSVRFCLAELMRTFCTGADGRTPRLDVAPEPAGDWQAAFAARWQNVLEVMQGVARQVKPTYGFDVRDLTFELWEPTDPGIVFSIGLGTMGAYSLVAQRPDANWLAVLGQGEMAERDVVTVEGDWRPWFQGEDTKDRRDVEQGSLDALRVAGEEELRELERPPAVSVTPIDVPAQQFGRDYGLGDLATVTFPDGTEVHEIVSEVTIQLQENKPLTVIPTVGDPQMTLDTFRRMNALSRRLSILEAR